MEWFTELFPGQGYDHDGGPSQMVPSGGTRFVKLIDGANMTVESSDIGVCEVIETDMDLDGGHGSERNVSRPRDENVSRSQVVRFFKIIGGQPGQCHVLGKNIHPFQDAKLNVAVKKRRQQLVTFTICFDASGRMAKVDNESTIANYYQYLRQIWLGQANVNFINHGIRRQEIMANLGDIIWMNTGSPMPSAILSLSDHGADLNVFFVWKLRWDNEPSKLAEAITAPGVCIFAGESEANMPTTLAHEIGHHLGIVGHDFHSRKHLMYEHSPRGDALTNIDIDTVNP